MGKLHSALGRCKKLQCINVENNQLKGVAKRIGELPELKVTSSPYRTEHLCCLNKTLVNLF
jgi:hypothetical protein